MENTNLFPSFSIITNQNKPPPPLTCASGVPQQPQHLSVGRINTSSGMAWNSTTKTFGTFGSQKLVLWVHVSPFSKAGPFHVKQRGVFGFAIHLQKVVDFFTTHRSYSYKDDIRQSKQRIKPLNLASLTTSGCFFMFFWCLQGFLGAQRTLLPSRLRFGSWYLVSL